MPFSSLFGLDPAIMALRRSLESDQLAGTYLFAGPSGTGQTAPALAFAEAAACQAPPPYARFVLLTPHPARTLPTILSRSQIVRVSPARVPALTGYLRETLGLGEEEARSFAAYAEGRTGAALRLARNPAARAEIER